VTWGFEKAKASKDKEILPLSQITQIKGFFYVLRMKQMDDIVYLPRTRQQGKHGTFQVPNDC
jgi:hypothetical protein